jgi:hypothetical protein
MEQAQRKNPAGLGERAAEQEFDLGVGPAQLVAGPSGQGIVDGGVEPEQDALALGHRSSGRRYRSSWCASAPAVGWHDLRGLV